MQSLLSLHPMTTGPRESCGCVRRFSNAWRRHTKRESISGLCNHSTRYSSSKRTVLSHQSTEEGEEEEEEEEDEDDDEEAAAEDNDGEDTRGDGTNLKAAGLLLAERAVSTRCSCSRIRWRSTPSMAVGISAQLSLVCTSFKYHRRSR